MRTVLWVENNAADLMLVEDIVERLPGIRLLSSRDGDHDIALARSALPKVILMDINLPDINGFNAMRILKQDFKTAHMPVIALNSVS
ncbi:MAG: domain S-box protein [Proteobacteria bacterium]|nr:domain S-box protein [Pseudomonadota bacterium]